MAFVAGFGLDIGLSAVSILSSFAPAAEVTVARIGIGSQARDDTSALALEGGITPTLIAYDTHGAITQVSIGSGTVEPASNSNAQFQLDGDSSTTPEYLRMSASSSDAVCVSYISMTSAAQDQRTWHAGYARQCNDIGGGNFWYASPEIIPGTDFRPGCVWISQDDRFLQGISFKLTDFGFPDSPTAQTAQDQYTQFPNTLCQAPGRMTLWKKLGPEECIPFYNFDNAKDATTGFDQDFQKIVDGHSLTCDTKEGATWNQQLEPGKGPRTLTTQQQADADAAQAAANEAGTNTNAPPSGAGNFGGVASSIPLADAQQDQNEAGLNTDAPPDGAGNFGGSVGSIPNSQAGKDFTTTLPGASSTAASQPMSTDFRTPGPPVKGKRSSISQARVEALQEEQRGVLARRQALTEKRDYCVDKLVVSHLKEHSATELCEMSNSWGPDFVSVVEGVYCDMCERELWSLCDESTTQYCFDLETKKVRYPKHTGLRDDRLELAKKFVTVDEWE